MNNSPGKRNTRGWRRKDSKPYLIVGKMVTNPDRATLITMFKRLSSGESAILLSPHPIGGRQTFGAWTLENENMVNVGRRTM